MTRLWWHFPTVSHIGFLGFPNIVSDIVSDIDATMGFWVKTSKSIGFRHWESDSFTYYRVLLIFLVNHGIIWAHFVLGSPNSISSKALADGLECLNPSLRICYSWYENLVEFGMRKRIKIKTFFGKKTFSNIKTSYSRCDVT